MLILRSFCKLNIPSNCVTYLPPFPSHLISLCPQMQTQREIQEFQEQRAQWRAYELAQMEKENQAILAHAQSQQSIVLHAFVPFNVTVDS